MSKRIFLDYASTTPLDKTVVKRMQPYFNTFFGNPSAIYDEGVFAKKAVDESREKIASILGVRSDEVIFTASGTESDNLALIGTFRAFKNQLKPHFIVSNIEHPGVIEACKYIEQEGGEVSYIGVEDSGIVDPKKIAEALQPTTVLVSVMYVNNEIGTIQPLREISREIDLYKDKGISAARDIPFLHTDASQAANYLDLSFQKLGVDMMTLDASKIYGPKGVGILGLRRRAVLKPIIFGGGQEGGLRSGTENVPGIVGAAAALLLAQTLRENETNRLTSMREYFFDNLLKLKPEIIINGDRKNRLPNNVNICVPGLDAEFAVLKLNHLGVSCSSASSCMNLSENSYSDVVEKLGEDGKKCKESSLRFSLGRHTTQKEIDLTLRKIQSIIISK